MLIIGIIIALAFFFYFQKKHSERNMDRFQRNREKFEELLESLRKAKENKTGNDDPENKITHEA